MPIKPKTKPQPKRKTSTMHRYWKAALARDVLCNATQSGVDARTAMAANAVLIAYFTD